MRGWMLLCGALLSLAACRESPADAEAEAAIERSAGGKAEIENGRHTLSAKTAQGKMTIGGGDDLALPKAFPKDVYLPEGYRVRQVIEMAKATVVTITVPNGSADLIADAESTMQGSGWKRVMSSTNANGTGMLIFEKDRRRAALTLGMQGDTAERVIQVQLTAKR